MSEHTPTPWRIIETMSSCAIHAGKREVLRYAHSPDSENRANARHIVKCVNSHERLVKALKAAYAVTEFAPGVEQDKIEWAGALLAELEE